MEYLFIEVNQAVYAWFPLILTFDINPMLGLEKYLGVYLYIQTNLFSEYCPIPALSEIYIFSTDGRTGKGTYRSSPRSLKNQDRLSKFWVYPEIYFIHIQTRF